MGPQLLTFGPRRCPGRPVLRSWEGHGDSEIVPWDKRNGWQPVLQNGLPSSSIPCPSIPCVPWAFYRSSSKIRRKSEMLKNILSLLFALVALATAQSDPDLPQCSVRAFPVPCNRLLPSFPFILLSRNLSASTDKSTNSLVASLPPSQKQNVHPPTTTANARATMQKWSTMPWRCVWLHQGVRSRIWWVRDLPFQFVSQPSSSAYLEFERYDIRG